jgi:predicted NAD-dependent protein-ADP-ribosyltransferase YbiA (DUF1768 family)
MSSNYYYYYAVDDTTCVSQNELINRICGLATAASDGEICSRDVFSNYDEKRRDIEGRQFIGVVHYSRQQTQHY